MGRQHRDGRVLQRVSLYDVSCQTVWLGTRPVESGRVIDSDVLGTWKDTH